jgi:hypothetical protein
MLRSELWKLMLAYERHACVDTYVGPVLIGGQATTAGEMHHIHADNDTKPSRFFFILQIHQLSPWHECSSCLGATAGATGFARCLMTFCHGFRD